jgi:RES domain-containing protein
MKLHPDTEKLRERLRECLDSATSWSGAFYRATTVEYSNRQDLLTGTGSRKAGARWNAAGSFNAVYGCLEPETAMDEALANYRDYGIPVSEALPLVFVAVTVELQSVLDLTNRDVQRTLGVSARRMTTTPWRAFHERDEEAITQAVGRLAFEEMLEGILVPSARRSGTLNIVLFPSRRRRGSSWKIERARKLPKKRKKGPSRAFPIPVRRPFAKYGRFRLARRPLLASNRQMRQLASGATRRYIRAS